MAPAFASRTIEVTVISAENLQIRGKPIKNVASSFVCVKSDSQNSQSTKSGENGGGFQVWNEKLVLDLPMHAPFLILEVECRTSRRKIKTVGTARVPVAEFTGGYVPESRLQFLSYRLRDERGERNGIINVAVRVKVAAGNGGPSPKKPEMGVPVPVALPLPEGNFGGGEIVTGIPVWNVGYPARF